MQNGIYGIPSLVPSAPGKLPFWSGYQIGTWSSVTGMGDGTNSGGNTLTNRISSGLTAAASPASTIPMGIVISPVAPGSVYFVSVSSNISSVSGGTTSVQLTDGTYVLSTSGNQYQGAGATYMPFTLSGIYVATSGGPITLKVQINNSGGASSTMGQSTAGQLNEWTVVQIA